jgi:Beta-glucosidase-related glycosidases
MDIKDVLSQMTLEEKAKFCSGADFWNMEGLERFGIPKLMITDGPCGLRKQAGASDHLGINDSVKAISFPTGSCVANSFDRDLMHEMGEILAEECQAEDVAVLLGPAVNIKRSPLCGRNFEYFSEDPYLTGELAAAYINGVQSKNIGTSIKHFAANSQEHRRMTSDSIVDERTLREIYYPAFETAVKSSAPWTVMSSYNKLNGEYASENTYLLTDVLRKEWGFEGAVVSDWGAVNDRVMGLLAGMDLEMPGDSPVNEKKIIEAVNNGKLPIETLDVTVERILAIIKNYTENKKEGVSFQYERDHQKAKDYAAQSMVLLKNDDILPLNKEANIAFIGQFADKPRFQGGGSSHVASYKVEGSVESASGYKVSYAQGYIIDKDEIVSLLEAEAVDKAKKASAAVVFIGIPDELESEGFDRSDLDIPSAQIHLLEEILKVQKNVIVVVQCGGPIVMPWIDDVKGVLYAYLGGEAVGGAIVDILFGVVNPSAKLAESFPKKLEDNPSYLYYFGEGDRVEYREGVFVGYRYYDKKKLDVLFPFGFGLSYTEFEYSNLTLSADKIQDTDTLTATVTVKNTGNVSGKEIVQLYVSDSESTVIRPKNELKGFEKVALNPGEEKQVIFTLDKRSFAYYNMDISDWHVESGDFVISIGKSSRDIVLQKTVSVVSTVALPIKYSINSTVGDVMKHPVGQAFVGQVLSGMTSIMEKNDEAMGSSQAMMSMIKNAPIRAILSFSQGKLSIEMLEGLVLQLNHS